MERSVRENGTADLEARFERAWGSTDEIFAPSPTVFSVFGGYDVKLDLNSLISHPEDRIDSKSMQQIGYDHLKRVVDKLAQERKATPLRKLMGMISNAMENDVNFVYWKRNQSGVYARALEIPNQFLEYARDLLSGIEE